MREDPTQQPRQGKPRRRAYLALRIGLLYVLLAAVNITFFSVVILENQSDLLLGNFKYRAESIVKSVLDEDVADLRFPAQPPAPEYELLRGTLDAYDVQRYVIFDTQGRVRDAYVSAEGEAQTPAPNPGERVEAELLDKIVEFTKEESLFRSRYIIDLDEERWSLDFLLPLSGRGERLFLAANLNVRTMQERVQYLQFQVLLAVVWGVIFHLLFAIFVFRLIFRRVNLLKGASLRMAGGRLNSRADWNRGRTEDELDELGDAFNSMAANIQDQVETITDLNDQIQNELAIGQEVQELFLGDEDLIESLKPALLYRPLRQVSGDVYKYFEFEDGSRAVFFADASGHGVSAALVTTITLLSLDEVLREHREPCKIMEELSNLMAVRLDTTFFATAVFVYFEAGGAVHLTNAGHNAPLILPADGGELREIKPHGPPLGFIEDAPYKQETVSLTSSDRIFLYTDGLTEAANVAAGDEKELYGIERVEAILDQRRGESAEKIIEHLEQDFDAFAGHITDDVTVLILEVP